MIAKLFSSTSSLAEIYTFRNGTRKIFIWMLCIMYICKSKLRTLFREPAFLDTVSQQGSVYSILSEDFKTFCPAFSPQKIRLNSKIYDDKTLSIKIGN